ncbi:MAG: hypothetical protein PHV82_07095 [Victivallaceae bacterium]|nr:hypothetical protein [Victivallaceae bacterium]
MTIGEEVILSAVLNDLRKKDLISDKTFDASFKKLELPEKRKTCSQTQVRKQTEAAATA